jgi:RNA polymerase sigma-70 factor, ECF subfamily
VFYRAQGPRIMRDPRDEHLIDQLRTGDQLAVAELASIYGPKIYQLAFRYVKNREDAEEVAQDVLLKVVTKIHAFRGDAALSSWIYRITFNAAMSRLRSARAARSGETHEDSLDQPGVHGELPGARELADWSSMADEEVLRGEMRRRLMKAVLELPAIYRVPVVLRDIHGLTTQEASAVLHVKDQTLKSRLHRGRLILRARLAEFASGLALHRPMPA